MANQGPRAGEQIYTMCAISKWANGLVAFLALVLGGKYIGMTKGMVQPFTILAALIW
jgi:hypothetical protein